MRQGWEEKKLGEIAKAIYGYTESASYTAVGPKFLRITDLQNDGVNWDSVPFCKISDADFRKAVTPIKAMVTKQKRIQKRYGNTFNFDVDAALMENRN